MRAIERTTQFKRDFKREMRGRYRNTLQADLTTVLRALVSDTPQAKNTATIRCPASGSAFETATPNPIWC